MAYDVTQISNLVNDAASDITGTSATINTLDSTGLVSLGVTLSSANLYEGWFSALTKRIAKTVYFVRSYTGRTRQYLRSEEEYGAFTQKVYYDLPQAVDNAEWDIPNQSGLYKQHSPYDIETTLTVTAQIFGGKGAWAIEIIRPISQIKEAFLSMTEMMKFIDGIYVQIENAYKVEEEALVSLACNTAMADALDGGVSRNLLTEYNAIAATPATVANALYNPDFLKFANKEISKTIKAMKRMATIFNKAGYNTFTDQENLIVELLEEFSDCSKLYVEADTFNQELVALPGYTPVDAWQFLGHDGKVAFADASKIKVTNDAINGGEATEQSGIIAFVHDIENVAAYFGNRESWEMVNPRDNIVIHGERATKGFSVDGHANAVVFYIA